MYSALTDLSIEDVLAIARGDGQVLLLDEANAKTSSEQQRLQRIRQSAAWVQSAMVEVEAAAGEGRDPTADYGINTGFGDNAGRPPFPHIEQAERQPPLPPRPSRT